MKSLSGPQIRLLRKLGHLRRSWYEPESSEWQSAYALIDLGLVHRHFKNARKIRPTEQGKREIVKRLNWLIDAVRSAECPSQEEIDAWMENPT